MDDLLPISSMVPPTRPFGVSVLTDQRGFGPYARVVNGLLHAFVEDRRLARQNFWALRHFFALNIYSEDVLIVQRFYGRSSVYDGKINTTSLQDILARVKQVSVYLFNSLAAEDGAAWRRVVLEKLLNEAPVKVAQDELSEQQKFLLDVIDRARKEDRIIDTRILAMVLRPLLTGDMDVSEADLWVQLARKLERTGRLLFSSPLFILIPKPFVQHLKRP